MPRPKAAPTLSIVTSQIDGPREATNDWRNSSQAARIRHTNHALKNVVELDHFRVIPPNIARHRSTDRIAYSVT